jgi:monothiol glutaredoxin
MSNEDVLKQIDQEIKSNKILLYIKGTKDAPQCGFSATTLKIFNELQCSYETVDVLTQPDRRSYVPEYSKWPTFPQVFINGKLVGGCDIILEMYENGELKTLVDEALKTS